MEATLDPFVLALYRERREMLQRFKNALIAAGVEFYVEEESQKKFTWLFLATYPNQRNIRPLSVRALADTEEEARSDLTGKIGSECTLIFAAKIRSECPLYRYSSGVYELDVQALAEVHHG